MISRATDLATPLAVDKISPLLSTQTIGHEANAQQQKRHYLQNQQSEKNPLSRAQSNPLQNAFTLSGVSQFKAAQFIAGEVYPAQVLAHIDKQTSIVKLNGVTIKMSLGHDVAIGQNLLLKFMGSEPSPTFLLTQASPTPNMDITRISASAQLIQHYLKPDPQGAGATHIKAHLPITSSPNNAPVMIAHDFQRAISQTGLFYESHLAAYLEGKYSLTDITQEPQNHHPKFAEHVVSQQLNLLEHPKLVWHGEVWPQQMLEWEIERRKHSPSHETSQSSHESESIHSKLSLQLPHLGHISAELKVQNGKLRIQILATDIASAHLLKSHSQLLSNAIQASGQTLEQLTVAQHVTQS